MHACTGERLPLRSWTNVLMAGCAERTLLGQSCAWHDCAGLSLLYVAIPVDPRWLWSMTLTAADRRPAPTRSIGYRCATRGRRAP